MMTFGALLGSLELGMIYAVLALGEFLSFRTLNMPDLTVDGSIVSVCKDCGATDRVVLPATGHKLVSSGHDATCTQSGYVRYMCSQCLLV